MPIMFTFGVPSIFNFTFRAGSKLPGLADGTIDGESNSSDNRESESSKEVRLIAPLPSHGTESNSPSPCGSLNKVPLEVRNMIYSNVLKFDLDIVRPHRFLGRHPPILAEDSKHIRAIDAALLRTCKAIYHETIRILYHRNRFYFCKPSDIKEFAHAGLGATPFGFYNTINRPSDAVTHAPYGRLTTIRTMRLKLGSEKEGDDLEKVWSFWSEFFYPPEKQEHLDQVVGFPSLERLSLDLRKWKLRISDTNAPQIRVKPFLRKLRPTGGLQHLTLVGVVHEQNLRDFKHGFVRQGGTFRPAPQAVKTVATTTVSHDDLPEVSMFVRAIVEKDRASRAISANYEIAGTSDSR